MSLAINCCKLINSRVNNIYKFGGYVSRNAMTVQDYKIKWVRPPQIPITDPKKSGDLGLDIPVKATDIKVYYEKSKELEDANDIVKKMFTLEFQPRRAFRDFHREQVLMLVKRHVCDRGSTEIKIAAITSEIDYIRKCREIDPRNKKTKVFLKELIEKRAKFLRLLRRWDYRRFEWILERLNLVLVALPPKLGMVSRKDSIRRLTQVYCDNIVQKKLDAYRMELREEQKIFYAEKAEKLAYILETEKECGVTPTVTEEDIEATRKKLAELLKTDSV